MHVTNKEKCTKNNCDFEGYFTKGKCPSCGSPTKITKGEFNL